MKIIGITGKMGAGKDAVALAMGAADPTVRRIALADAIKRTASDLFGLSYEQTNGTGDQTGDQKKAVDPRWGKSPREILQTLGTEVGRAIHPNVWIEKMREDMSLWERCRITYVWSTLNNRWERVYQGHNSAQASPIWVVPDVRFENEAAAIREWGGVILRVRRNFYGVDVQSCASCGFCWFPGVTACDMDSYAWHSPVCPHAHPSERELENIEADVTFYNREGLENVDLWAIQHLAHVKALKGW